MNIFPGLKNEESSLKLNARRYRASVSVFRGFQKTVRQIYIYIVRSTFLQRQLAVLISRDSETTAIAVIAIPFNRVNVYRENAEEIQRCLSC